MTGAFLIAVVFFGPSSVIAAEPIKADALEFAALSGEWEGYVKVLQRGNCTISRGERSDIEPPRKTPMMNPWEQPSRHDVSALTIPVKATFDVASDGAFKARILQHGARSKSAGRQVTGVFRADSSVEATQVEQATCKEEERQYTIALSGKLSTKKGRYQLELSGDNPTCPEMKCVFEQRYKLTHK